MPLASFNKALSFWNHGTSRWARRWGAQLGCDSNILLFTLRFANLFNLGQHEHQEKVENAKCKDIESLKFPRFQHLSDWSIKPISFEASTFVNVRCWRRVSWPPILPALHQIDLIAPSWPQLFVSKDHSYQEQEIQMIQIAEFSFNKARSSFQHPLPSLAHASPAKQQNI